MKIHVVTLGCPKNIVDSEYLIGGLTQAGVTFVNDPIEAEIIIINTCSFILEAREEAIETIFEAVQLKKSGNCNAIYVVGCLPQKYKKELEDEMPEVDGFFEQLDFSEIARQISTKIHSQAFSQVNRKLITPTHYAYLKIAEGCNNRCSYCTIPLIKGNYQSKDVTSLLKEVELLVKRGVRELIVIAQDITYYGRDGKNVPKITELIKQLCSFDELKWIRLLYAHPAHVNDELINLLKDEVKICKYIDLPLQHISDRILRDMRRKVTGEQVRLLIEKLRKEIPDIAIRTSFIVGFPGETDDDFAELLQFIKAVRFERLGVFKYSREEETIAASLPNQVSEEEKENRLQDIMAVQSSISYENNLCLVNKEIDVIVDDFDNAEKCYIARSQWDSPHIDNRVLIKSNVTPGDFQFVKIVEAMEYDLIGTVVE